MPAASARGPSLTTPGPRRQYYTASKLAAAGQLDGCFLLLGQCGEVAVHELDCIAASPTADANRLTDR